MYVDATYPLKNNYTLNFGIIFLIKIFNFDVDVKLTIQDNNKQISCLDVNTFKK